VIPIVLYVLFCLAIVGVTGSATTPLATVGLGAVFGSKILVLANVFVLITMLVSFLSIGLSLKQFYKYDYKLPDWLAYLLVIVVPLLIYGLVSRDFIAVTSVAGSLVYGFSGIMVVCAFWKARKKGDLKPEFLCRIFTRRCIFNRGVCDGNCLYFVDIFIKGNKGWQGKTKN